MQMLLKNFLSVCFVLVLLAESASSSTLNLTKIHQKILSVAQEGALWGPGTFQRNRSLGNSKTRGQKSRWRCCKLSPGFTWVILLALISDDGKSHHSIFQGRCTHRWKCELPKWTPVTEGTERIIKQNWRSGYKNKGGTEKDVSQRWEFTMLKAERWVDWKETQEV